MKENALRFKYFTALKYRLFSKALKIQYPFLGKIVL